MMRSVSRWYGGAPYVLLCCWAALACACGSNLQLTKLQSATSPPANVAVSLTVHDQQGSPVSGLTAKNFAVLQDGKRVPRGKARLRVVNAGREIHRHTLVLVDMGDSVVAEDGGARLANLVSDFVAELEAHQKVAVYAFDSQGRIQRIRRFINSDQGRKGLFTLLSVRTASAQSEGGEKDVYRVLGDAVGILQRQLRNARLPDAFGTLVLLSAGADQAERKQRRQLLRDMAATGLAVYAVAVGEEGDAGLLSKIASEGYIHVGELAQAKAAFSEVSKRMTEWSKSHYVISYCSPSRSGTHENRLRVTYGELEQELEYPVDATGFRGGCRGKRVPNLVREESAEGVEGADDAAEKRRRSAAARKQSARQRDRRKRL